MAHVYAQDHGSQVVEPKHGSGGHPPTSLGINSRKLGLWTFISSEALFFTALIASYLVMRGRNLQMGGPHPHDFMNITLTSILAFILLLSSLTMVLALAATERNDQRGIRIWLAATMLLGLAFLGGQVYEYTEMFHERFVTVTITEQDGTVIRQGVAEHHLEEELAHIQQDHPGAQISQGSPKPVTWTTSLFGSTFFTMTGFHGTHVLVGAIWLGVVLVMALRGAIGPQNSLTVEMAGLYWHFVDLVWVAIFTLVYLL